MNRRTSRTRPTYSTTLQVTRCEDRLTPTTLYGLAGSGLALIPFDSATPSAAVASLNITGLNAGESLQAIDFRPATGELFGLTLDKTGSRIGTINLTTGAFAGIGASFAVAGTDFGFDFNPTNDRIRVTTDADANLLIDPNTGAVTVQGNLNPGNPNIVASAYTNNFANATVTTLFGIDSTSNQLFQQVPATGTLTLIGDLGVDPNSFLGFDIAGNGTAFAAMTIGSFSTLFTINLSTGAATSLGNIGSTTVPLNVRGLAVARFVWDGGGTNPNWTTPANWVGDIAPQSGDDLVFPGGAAQIIDCTNDFSTSITFNSMVFTGNGYDIDGNGISLTAGLTDTSVGGLNDVDLDIQLTGTQIFSVAQASQTLALGGMISGGPVASLNKEKAGSTSNNAGILLMNGTSSNSYQGTTTVNGGQLQLAAAGSTSVTINGPLVVANGLAIEFTSNQIGDSVSVDVFANGTLNLNGNSDVVGAVRVTDGKLITAGGRLTTTNNVVFSGAATLSMQLIDTNLSDRVTVNGTVNLNGTLQLSSPTIVPTGSVIVLIDNDGADAITGAFTNAAEGQTLNVGGVNMTISYMGGDGNDVTLTVLNTITGRVFEDRDGDGTQLSPPLPGTDPGIAAVRVYEDANGNDAFDPGELFTLTDANGDWTLTFNTDGTRTIRHESPAGYVQTTPQPANIPLTAGQTVAGVDFGDFKLGAINGTVFNDLNGNGVRDATEPGMPNVTVQLDINVDGTIDAQTLTDSAGFYAFLNLGPASYNFRQVVPAGFQQTTVNPLDVALQSGAIVTGNDFGNQQLANQVRLLAVGAGQGGGPHVQVYNADGSIRFSFFAYDASFRGGVSVATADVTGDGVDDIITGAGPGGGPHVKVFDGVNLNLVRSFFAYNPAFLGGVNVAAADFNNNGRADIVTGAGAGGGPHVIVYDSVSLALLASFYAYDPSFAGGVNVAAADVTGDGRPDVVTGAGPGGGPHVKVIDIATNTTALSFFAYMSNFMGGVSVAAGDVDDDGQADIVTGPGFCNAPDVKIFSGATGQIMRLIRPYASSFIGGVRVGAVDLDGDGVVEVLTGAGPSGGPDVGVFRGDNGTQLNSFFAFDPSFMGGVFVG